MIMWNKNTKKFLTFVLIIPPKENKVKFLNKLFAKYSAHQLFTLVNFSRKRIDIKRTLLYNLVSDTIRKERVLYVFGRLSYSQ